MTPIERTILIDNYQIGNMTKDEKSEFERLLLTDDLSSKDIMPWKKEMELQDDIILGIKERGLLEMLQMKEQQLSKREKRKKITIWSLSSGGIVSAMAAIIIVLLIIAPMARTMQNYSTQYVGGIEISNVRGDNMHLTPLQNALVLMQNNQWEEAETIIDKTCKATTDSQDEQQLEMYNEAEWLKTICLMHRGKSLQAKRMLKKIAKSESHYKSRAAEVLESL